MSAYESALYQFVVGASSEQIAEIKKLVDKQEKAEKHWARARAQVPSSELENFDKTIYQDFVRLSRSISLDLQALKVPLFQGPGSDPKAQQKLLALLADLAKHTPKQVIIR